MSAYEVCDEHIDALVTAGLAWGEHGPLRWTVGDPADEDGTFEPGAMLGGPRALEWYEAHKRELTYDTADEVGAMLRAENRRSVNYRYDEDDLEAIYTFRRLAGTPDPLIVLKAIGCYEYQACEHPGWRKSSAAAFCIALRFRAIDHLPGMREAPGWEVHDRNVFLNRVVAPNA